MKSVVQKSCAFALVVMTAVGTVGAAEKYLWTELLAFDADASDFGVGEYLGRMPIRPKGVSLLLTDPEIVHAHRGLERDFPIGDVECAYCGRPWNEERQRQRWTAWQLRGLVGELKRHGVEAYPSFFEISMASNSQYIARFGLERRPGFWIDAHPEVLNQVKSGKRHSGICVIKHLSDGTLYEDFFTAQLVRFLTEYGFAGFHAADGYGHPRSPVCEGDFSDDVVAQFLAAEPTVRIPDGLSFAARADWLLGHCRESWSRFYARRHAEFLAKVSAALRRNRLSLRPNTSWTCDPHEALFRYGEDYRLLEKAGIDGFFAEASATVLTIEGWGNPHLSKLDLCRAALLRTACAVNVPAIHLACVKDGMEEYNSLRHAPALMQAEVLGLQTICRGDRRASPDIFWCLTDGITPDEGRAMDALWTLLPLPAEADGVRVVWSDRAHDAELSAYCQERHPSSFVLLAELLHAGASLCSGVRLDELNPDDCRPLLVLNPGLFPEVERAALRRRKGRTIFFGLGADGCSPGPRPTAAETVSWREPLPVRRYPQSALEVCVKEINALAFAVPDEGMEDLRVMSYRAADGSRVVVALNDRGTYLNARIRVRCRPDAVRSLTESPSLPVRVEPGADASVLVAKIPPYGVVVLSLRQELTVNTKQKQENRR